MSKIARYAGNLRAFGSNAQGLERTIFGENTQADDLTSQITDSFLRGWGIVGPSENPSMEDFNAAMYALSQFISYQHQMGVPEWDAEQEYYIGSLCVRAGETYSSLADNNIGSAPPSAKWTQIITAKNGLPGRLLNIRLITTSQIYTPTTGAKKIIIEAVAGGGGGGGAPVTTASQSSCGSGGGSGDYVKTPLLSAQSLSINIGSGGAGSNGLTTPAAGGDTTVGNIILLRGGSAGTTGSASTANTILGLYANGSPSTAMYPASSLYLSGGQATRGMVIAASAITGTLGGSGGGNPLGGGAIGQNAAAPANSATEFGGGGAGAANFGASGSKSGGSGFSGAVIIWEYA
jgi:hypothetical protein